MYFCEDKQAGVVVVALDPGDLLLESLRRVAREADVPSGVVLSGIGSLSRGHFHAVVTNDYPPADEFVQLEGPLEIGSFGGIIAGHEPHVHINVMTLDGRYYGGHVEEGCAVLTLAEISILRLPSLRLERRPTDGTKVGRLRPIGS